MAHAINVTAGVPSEPFGASGAQVGLVNFSGQHLTFLLSIWLFLIGGLFHTRITLRQMTGVFTLFLSRHELMKKWN